MRSSCPGFVVTRRAAHAAVQAAQGRGGEHALGRAADAHHGVHVGAAHRGGDAGGQVAVADQPDARPGGADVGDQLLVPLAIEHDDDEVLDVTAEAPGDRLQVRLHRRVEVDDVARRRSDDDLVHVAVGRVQQTALVRRRQHGDGARRTRGAEIGALERIDRDVDLEVLVTPAAHVLADEQHRRLVALALADHHRAAHGQRVHGLAHRLHGDVVGVLALPLPHGARRLDGCELGHTQEVAGQ